MKTRSCDEALLKPFTFDDLVLLRLISRGLPLRAIARSLACSERTVRRRTHELCERAEVDTPIEAVVLAVRRGLI